jgi:hypothetical protein
MMTVATMSATTTLNSHDSSGSKRAASGACIAVNTKPTHANRRWRGVRKPGAWRIRKVCRAVSVLPWDVRMITSELSG